MAAATAIIGTTLAVGGAAMNFAQAAKQGKLQRQAEQEADKAMAAARSELEKNFYKGLDINLKSFDRERDPLARQGQQILQAGQEADRGAAAVAGRVMLGTQQGEQNITDRQIDSLEKLEQTVAQEESRLATSRARLDLAEVEGAQEAAAEAAKNQAANISAGIQGLGAAATGLSASSELYNSKGAREAARTARQVDAGKILPNSGLKVNQNALQDQLRGGGTDGSGDALSKGGGVFQNIFQGVTGLFKRGN
tara:strand:+ start:161 stop:916 length:756 start_codon:yes stop_codon:yes gene_type:complete